MIDVGHCLLEINTAYVWLWLCDTPLAIAAMHLSRGWGLRNSLKVPALAVLHIGFAWLEPCPMWYLPKRQPILFWTYVDR
jgi:uncharacterized protein involved in response to NO